MTDSEMIPWYRRTSTILVLALFVLAAGVGVGLILAGDGDDVDNVSTAATTVATTPTTTTAPTTTVVTTTTAPAEDRCVAGDQRACDDLTDDVLDELCDDGHGSLDACQVMLAHQGDGLPDGPNGESSRGGEGSEED